MYELVITHGLRMWAAHSADSNSMHTIHFFFHFLSFFFLFIQPIPSAIAIFCSGVHYRFISWILEKSLSITHFIPFRTSTRIDLILNYWINHKSSRSKSICWNFPIKIYYYFYRRSIFRDRRSIRMQFTRFNEI